MSLAPGTRLGPYEIQSEIGAGGMGQVYRARDTRLGRDVAVKVLPRELGADPDRRRRFELEARAVAALSHPNIVALYDIGALEGTSFLVSELLEGETLAHALCNGALAVGKAVEIGIQMAKGLSAAHVRGIVHRDLKPSNVFLTLDGQVKLLDFGVAKQVAPSAAGAESATVTVEQTTEAGTLLGTVGYMSPEQVRALPCDHRADIFAFGCVLYEMLAGHRAFKGDTAADTMSAILKEDPPSLIDGRQSISPVLQQIVDRCLEKRAEDRFSSAHDLALALAAASTGSVAAAFVATVPAARDAPAGVTVRTKASVARGVTLDVKDPGPSEEAEPRGRAAAADRRRIARWTIAGAALAILLAVGLGWWLLARAPVPGGPAGRRSVAVLGLTNLSGRSEVAWLAVALAEMLTSELGAGEIVRTISGESVARLRAELPIANFDTLAPDTLSRVRNRLGSDLLVLGSYTALGAQSGGQIRLDVRLQDARDGNVVASVSETGTEVALFDLVSRAGARLREKLGIATVTAAERDAVQASLPQDPVAVRLYSEGLAHLRAFDTPGARDLLEQAKARDPKHAMTRAALARVWTLLGYDRKAEEEVKQALDLSASLSREDRLSIEGQYCEAARQKDKAIEIYKSLVNFFPDNPEYALRLASVQEDAGKGKDAFNTLDALRKLPAPVGTDPRIDLAEAVTARYQSQSQRGVEAAVRAAKVAEALGAKAVLARARFEQGSNLQNLGKMDEAVAALTESERLFREVGDRRGVAAALNNRGLVLMGRSDLDGTEKVWTEALATYRSIGNRSGEVLLISNLGNVDYLRGNPAGARQRWEQALPIYRELNEPEGEGMVLINIASVLGEQGEIARSRTMFEQALALYQKIGHKSRVLTALGNIAACQRLEGDLVSAAGSYQAVMTLWKETGDKEAAAPFIQKSGDLLRDKADFAGARTAYNDALTLREQMKQEGEAADVRLSLLDLDVDEGKGKEAEPAARAALQVFERLKLPEGEGRARTLLARIAAADGTAAEAKSEAEQARTLAAKIGSRELRLGLEIACARVLGTVGDASESSAGAVLRHAQAEASSLGMVPMVFEARLALGELEGRRAPAAAKTRLRQLQKEAELKGFKRIAQRAAVAAR